MQTKLQAKIRDPDTDDKVEGMRDPPNIFWRVAAAFMYIIPWIDVIALGREVYHHFPFSIWLFLFPGKCICRPDVSLLGIPGRPTAMYTLKPMALTC